MTPASARVCPNCDRRFETEARGTVACPVCGGLVPDPGSAGTADMRPCPLCGERIPRAAAKCRACGEYFDSAGRPAGSTSSLAPFGGKDEGVAAVLSFFVPGLGHLYCGQIRYGLYIFFGFYLVAGVAARYFLVPLIQHGGTDRPWGDVLAYLIPLAGLGVLLVTGWIGSIVAAARAAREWSPALRPRRPPAGAPAAERPRTGELARPHAVPEIAPSKSPGDRERQALFAAGRARVAGHDWAKAAEVAREFTWRYPDHPDTKVLLAELRAALRQEIRRTIRSHRWSEAVVVAEATIGVFPESQDAQDLAARLSTLKLRAHLCPACGQGFPPGAERCPQCGAAVREEPGEPQADLSAWSKPEEPPPDGGVHGTPGPERRQ